MKLSFLRNFLRIDFFWNIHEDADFKLSTQMNRIYLNPNYNYKDGSISLRLGYQKTDRDFQSSYPFQTSSENTQIELFNKNILNKIQITTAPDGYLKRI